MILCLILQPHPSPLQLFMLNHFLFATWKKPMPKIRLHCACSASLKAFQAPENSENRVEFAYISIKAQNVTTKRKLLPDRKGLLTS